MKDAIYKTALQQLIKEIYKRPTEISQYNAWEFIELIEKYLQIEKEQIEISFDLGRDDISSAFIIDGEDYYDQKYNK